MPNPTDPDAGTNRTNAVSSDNLMTEAGLKYSGNYVINNLLNNVGVAGTWWSSTIVNTRYSYNLRINNNVDVLRPQSDNDDRYIGRSVRCFFFSTGSLGAGSYPLSYVYSGRYYWDTGRLYRQAVEGGYWSSSIVRSTNSYNLYMNNTRLIKADSNNKRSGFALRCI